MGDELDEIRRDDRLIEAAARGDLRHATGADDVAVGPLCALARVADARPLPRLDVDVAEVVAGRPNHRYAVRSLAVAVAAVATLSTSGVSAVVTGDPFRPAKAVWHQIQDHTALRASAGAERLHSGAALGGPVEAATDVTRQPARDAASPVPDTAATQGRTAHAPGQAEPGDAAAARTVADAGVAGGGGRGDDAVADDPSSGDRAAEPPEQGAPEGSAEREPQQDSTEGRQGGDEQETQPAPDDDPQPSPGEEPQPSPGEEPDSGLDPPELPGQPKSPEQQEPSAASAEDAPAEDGDVEQPPLSEPTATASPDEATPPEGATARNLATRLLDGSARDRRR